MTYASDIPKTFYPDVLRVADRLKCSGLDLLRPLMNESGLSFKSHNPTGDAVGIFQAMPDTLRNLGFVGGWQEFVKLDADQQLPWLEKYYRPHAGELVNPTAIYMATFCPAWLKHAVEPGFVICAQNGRADGGLSSRSSIIWYAQNRGLDKNHDEMITVSDLTLAIDAADVGLRWNAVVTGLSQARLNDIGFGHGLVPDTDAGPLTKAAVLRFQTAAGIPLTGSLDDTTVNQLFA